MTLYWSLMQAVGERSDANASCLTHLLLPQVDVE